MSKIYRIDLAPFVGHVLIKGGTNLRSGMQPDGRGAAPAIIGAEGLDTLNCWRYLFSDEPFSLEGKRWTPREECHAEEVAQ